MKKSYTKIVSGFIFIGLLTFVTINSYAQAERNRIRFFAPKQQENVQEQQNHRFGRFLGQDRFQHKGLLLKIIRELELTSEQIDQLKELKGLMREEIQSVKEAKKNLREVVMSDTSTEDAIRTEAAELGKVIGDAAVKMASVRQSFRSILTPEQLEKLDDIKSTIKEYVEARQDFRSEMIEIFLSEDDE